MHHTTPTFQQPQARSRANSSKSSEHHNVSPSRHAKLNEEDVFLPPHKPVHIDPRTHEHFVVDQLGRKLPANSLTLELNRHGSFGPERPSQLAPQETESPKFSGVSLGADTRHSFGQPQLAPHGFSFADSGANHSSQQPPTHLSSPHPQHFSNIPDDPAP